MKTRGIDTKNGLWRVYTTQLVGFGLWGRCVSYVRETAYHNMHANKFHIICMQKLHIICTLNVRIIRKTFVDQSLFFRINTTSCFFIWCTMYTHFHETGLSLWTFPDPVPSLSHFASCQLTLRPKI